MSGVAENKFLVLGDNTDERVDELLGSIIPKKYQKMYVLNLNNHSTSRMGVLKSKMNDFLKNQSIFMNYPKVLIAKDLNYSNENIQIIYSKMLSLLPDNMVMIASCSNTIDLPKNIVMDSSIVYVDNMMSKISDSEFWEWLNSENKVLHRYQVIDYLNRNFLLKYVNSVEYSYLQERIDTKSSNCKDELKKLILKTI